MSAFAFMSFAMAMVNGAVNVANNVNNNNNNNNNNDNDNNNNVANINIANANNNANNMNMVTAGRRRRKIVPGRSEMFEPGEIISEQTSDVGFGQNPAPRLSPLTKTLTLEGDRYAIKAVRVGYLEPNSSVSGIHDKDSNGSVDKSYNNNNNIDDNNNNNNNIDDNSSNNINFDGITDILSQLLTVFGDELDPETILNNFLGTENFSETAAKFLSEKVRPEVIKSIQTGIQLVDVLKEAVRGVLGQRRRRSVRNLTIEAEDVSLAALVYVDMFLRHVGSGSNPSCVALDFCRASKSGKLLGSLAEKVSVHLSDFAAELLVPDFRIDPVFLRKVTDLAGSGDLDCEATFSEC